MFSNPHFDRVRQVFADQFQPDGGGFLYRKSMKGAPIRVSEAERDDFVKAYNRRLRYLMWAILPATLILILLLVWLVPDTDSADSKVATWVGLAATIALFGMVHHWAWNAPARELERRPQEGAALSKDKARQLMFSRISYGQLGFAPLAGVALVWRASADTDVLHGWGLLWLIFAGLVIAAAAIQALRKWRYERS
jgi:uncharacterized integral membrane protein